MQKKIKLVHGLITESRMLKSAWPKPKAQMFWSCKFFLTHIVLSVKVFLQSFMTMDDDTDGKTAVWSDIWNSSIENKATERIKYFLLS